MKTIQIGEVAKQTNLATSTIRYYEQIGLLPPPQRKNGRRLYNQSILNQIRFIRAVQQMGHTLDEIKSLSISHADHASLVQKWRKQAASKIIELDEKISTLRQVKAQLTTSLDCACASLESSSVMTNFSTSLQGDTK